MSSTNQKKSAVEVLDGIVNRIVAQEGVSAQEARERVLRDCPDLREQLCNEANSDRPSDGTREREDLRKKAAALGSVPTFGRAIE